MSNCVRMCVCGHVQPWMGVYICTDVSACVYYVQYVAKRVLMSRSISTKSYIGMCILCTYYNQPFHVAI